MAKFGEKWRMIKKILKSDDSILICLENDGFDYQNCGNNLMFNQLFQRLTTYVPKWYSAWLLNNRK